MSFLNKKQIRELIKGGNLKDAFKMFFSSLDIDSIFFLKRCYIDKKNGWT